MDDKTVQKFFSDKPIQLHLFGLIHQYLHSLGNIEVKVTKSQIAFSNKRQFAWIWLPMTWDKKRPKDCVVLSFSSGKKIIHPNIVQIVEPYPNRFMHHVIVEKKSDINNYVKKWLKESYDFGDFR